MTHRLVKLLHDNAQSRRPKIIRGYDPDYDGDFDPDEDDVEDIADIDPNGDSATIYFYGVLGGWDQPETADLVRAIAALPVSEIHIRINSPGGYVFEAAAIQTALMQHKAKVIAHIDGVSASAASTLMLAAEEIEISPGGFVMIHNPETVGIGDAGELRSTADMLDKYRDSIVAQYVERTGIDAARLAAMMDAETWMGAEEAISLGFCDRLAARATATPTNLRRFDLTAWKQAPKALTTPVSPDKSAAARQMRDHLAAARDRAETFARILGR